MTVSELDTKRKRNEYARKWYAKNKDRICLVERLKVKTPQQKENHNRASKKYYKTHKEEHHILTKRYKDKLRALKPPKQVKEKAIKIKKIKIKLTSEERKIKEKMRYQRRRESIRQKYFRDKSDPIKRELINKKYRERIAKKKRTDPLFKLRRDIPNLIRVAIQRYGYTKNSKTYLILGCTWLELKEYLESKFETWMNWGNRGKYNGELNYGWDVDHIIPVSTAKSQEEMIRLNHYTNLQPLDSYINRHVKRNKAA